jgi:uncharacterized repeat protein (TIGR01451 family)
VGNLGDGPTSGAVSVAFSVPTGLTATALSGGTNWSCFLATLTCTRSDVLAAATNYVDELVLTVSVSSGAPSTIELDATVSGGNEPNSATGNNVVKYFSFLPQVADMTVMMSHAGSFSPGQVGAAYTIRAHNAGQGAASGNVTVSVNLPSGLSATAISGAGWSSCSTVSVSCLRSDALAPGASYPAIALTVSVSGSGTLNPVATVSGGGELNTANDTFTDGTVIGSGADLGVSVSHAGSLTHGQSAVYQVAVTNLGSATSAGKVTLSDVLPAGFTATAMSGSGWLCASWSQTCVRSDALAVGHSYPPIRLTVSIGSGVTGSVSNTVTVSGGGDVNSSNNSATDSSAVQ